MNKVDEAEIDRIVALPYSREFVPEEDGTWFARVVEFTGCISVGETQQEAFTMLEDAMRAWICDALEHGEPIPEPFASREYSGKFLVRVPPELHRDLARKAEREGVSLNQLVTTLVSASVGASSVEGVFRLMKSDLSTSLKTGPNSLKSYKVRVGKTADLGPVSHDDTCAAFPANLTIDVGTFGAMAVSFAEVVDTDNDLRERTKAAMAKWLEIYHPDRSKI